MYTHTQTAVKHTCIHRRAQINTDTNTQTFVWDVASTRMLWTWDVATSTPTPLTWRIFAWFSKKEQTTNTTLFNCIDMCRGIDIWLARSSIEYRAAAATAFQCFLSSIHWIHFWSFQPTETCQHIFYTSKCHLFIMTVLCACV